MRYKKKQAKEVKLWNYFIGT